jgi:hypothetical protein
MFRHWRRRWQGNNCIAYKNMISDMHVHSLLLQFCKLNVVLKSPTLMQVFHFQNAMQCLVHLFFYSSYSASRTPQKSVPKHASIPYQVLQYRLALSESKLPSSFLGTWSPIMPCPLPITQPIIGNEPIVCCQRGCEGRKAFSCGRKTAGLTFAPFKRSVARAERGPSAVVVVVEDVCARL